MKGEVTNPQDWKQVHADAAEAVFDVDSMQMVMEEFARNMGFKREGLPEYGLCKVVSYAAQIARAQALGFDPALLRTSPTHDPETVAKKERDAR